MSSIDYFCVYVYEIFRTVVAYICLVVISHDRVVCHNCDLPHIDLRTATCLFNRGVECWFQSTVDG